MAKVETLRETGFTVCLKITIPNGAAVEGWEQVLNDWYEADVDPGAQWEVAAASATPLGIPKEEYVKLIDDLDALYYPEIDSSPTLCGRDFFLHMSKRSVARTTVSSRVLAEDDQAAVIEISDNIVHRYINDFKAAYRYFQSLNAEYKHGYSEISTFNVYGDIAIVTANK